MLHAVLESERLQSVLDKLPFLTTLFPTIFLDFLLNSCKTHFISCARLLKDMSGTINTRAHWPQDGFRIPPRGIFKDSSKLSSWTLSCVNPS